MNRQPKELTDNVNFKLTLAAKCGAVGHPLNRDEFASLVAETFEQGVAPGSHFSYCTDMEEVWITVNGSEGATTIITTNEREWIHSLVPDLKPV